MCVDGLQVWLLLEEARAAVQRAQRAYAEALVGFVDHGTPDLPSRGGTIRAVAPATNTANDGRPLTVPEAAAELRVGEQEIRRLVHTGQLPRLAAGGRKILISRAHLEAFRDGDRAAR